MSFLIYTNKLEEHVQEWIFKVWDNGGRKI